MKQIVFRILLFVFALNPFIANAQNTAKEPTFIKNDEGAYVNRESLKMKPESYTDMRFYAKGKYPSHIMMGVTAISVFSKERLNELKKEKPVLLGLFFDGIKGKLAYVSFQNFKDKQKDIPFTDEEMIKIENALKVLNWKTFLTNKTHEDTFSGYYILLKINYLEKYRDEHERQ
jgi:hypothetical protein